MLNLPLDCGAHDGSGLGKGPPDTDPLMGHNQRYVFTH